MNKKGFTLIEIIVCIVLIIAIGGISFFAIRTIQNNITTKELKKIENKIYEASNVYLESKKDVKFQLQTNKNAVVIPLKVLHNEGYMDFGNINLKNQYVLLAQGSTDRASKCIDTTLVGTWNKDDDTVIYLCTEGKDFTTDIDTLSGLINDLDLRIDAIEAINITNKITNINTKITNINQEITNIKNQLNETKTGNLDYVKNQSSSHYYKGSVVNNYIEYKGKQYRILYVDPDDSVTIYNYDKFTDFQAHEILPSTTNRILITEAKDKYDKRKSDKFTLECYNNSGNHMLKNLSSRSNNDYTKTETVVSGTLIDAFDIANTVTCYISNPSDYPVVEWNFRGGYAMSTDYRGANYSSWLKGLDTNFIDDDDNTMFSNCGIFSYKMPASPPNYYYRVVCGNSLSSIGNAKDYKLRLKPCMKITNGSGLSSDPYKITNNCTK